MKLRGALLLVVAATLCMLSGLIRPEVATASIDVVNQWPAKPAIASNSAASPVTAIYTPGRGTNRLMLVAVATEYSGAQTPAFTVTYGGQTVTQIVNNTTGNNKIWLGYLNAAGIATGETGTKILSVTNSATTNLTAMYVSAAVYNGVDQTTPITGSGSLGITTAALTIGPVAYTMTGNQGLTGNTGLSVYVINWNNNVQGETTAPTGYTRVRNYLGTNFALASGYKVTTGASSESLTSTTTTTTAIAALAGVGLNPALRLSTIGANACGDCHGYPPVNGTSRNAPPGLFLGAHSKHSGSDEGEYAFVCTVCHKDNGTNIKHEDGFKNITGSKVPRNTYGGVTNIAITNSPPYTQTCTKSTCHSSGRTTPQYAASPVWTGTTTCLSCHGGRSAGGAASRSTSNFSMSTSHSQHLKYLTTEINCQMCHGKTAANHTALKDYTGAKRHADGTKNVIFTQIAYGSYTSYKSTASGSSANTKVCTNTACHGGSTRSAWSESAAVNSDHTCSHCHGTAGTSASTPVTGANRYNLRFFAPGYKKTGTVGSSTDQIAVSNNIRVGSHFKHLSSLYMKNIKCNECHKVPSTPFSADTNHTLNNARFNSGTLDFSQASSARILIGVASGSTPAQLAAFAGYTNGTASTAATCSSVYCHGSRMKTDDTSGSYRKPYWNYSAMINYTNKDQACGRCHGNPPRTGGSQATHKNYTAVGKPTVTCSGCHGMVVNSIGTIIAKQLHINGQVNASGGHEWSFGGIRHKNGGTGSIQANPNTYSNCTGCHSLTGGGAYPVTRGVASNINCQICHTNQANFTSTPGCGDCHGTNATGQPNGAASAFPNWSGSHSVHTAQTYVCADCHANGGSGRAIHGNYSGNAAKTRATVNIGFNTTKAGTAITYTAGTMTCSTSVCHGQKSPAWGAPVPAQQCRRCHGSQSLSYANFSSPEIAPGTGNIDTNRTTGVTPRGGVHQEHLSASSSMSGTVKCNNCHANLTTKAVNHAQLDNRTTATIAFNGTAVAASHSPTVSRVSGLTNCANVYCHHGARAEGTAAGQSGFASRAALVWNNSTLITGTTVANTCTNICHQMPPGGGVASDAHVSLGANGTYTTATSLQACNGCHPTINATIPDMASIFANKFKHIDGTVDGGSCSGCHGYEVGTWAAKAERSGVPQGKGAHEKHIAYLTTLYSVTLNPASDQFGSGTSWTSVCGVCHNGATHSTGETIPGTGRTISMPAAYSFGGLTPVYNGVVGVSSATTAKSCSNLSCHYLTTPIWSTY